jgi:hypothetical protein
MSQSFCHDADLRDNPQLTTSICIPLFKLAQDTILGRSVERVTLVEDVPTFKSGARIGFVVSIWTLPLFPMEGDEDDNAAPTALQFLDYLQRKQEYDHKVSTLLFQSLVFYCYYYLLLCL